MGAVPLRLVRIKKHQSFFKPWCKHFYALAYAPAGKPPKREGTEYPDLVRGQKPVLSAKPSPLPRVTALLRRRKEHSHLTVPFLRRGFSPRFSVLRAAAQSRVPVCHILFFSKIFLHSNFTPFICICQQLMRDFYG